MAAAGNLESGSGGNLRAVLVERKSGAAEGIGRTDHIHAGGNFREFLEILNTYRKPVVEYLADTGILGHARRSGTWRLPVATPVSIIPSAMN